MKAIPSFVVLLLLLAASSLACNKAPESAQEASKPEEAVTANSENITLLFLQQHLAGLQSQLPQVIESGKSHEARRLCDAGLMQYSALLQRERFAELAAAVDEFAQACSVDVPKLLIKNLETKLNQADGKVLDALCQGASLDIAFIFTQRRMQDDSNNDDLQGIFDKCPSIAQRWQTVTEAKDGEQPPTP